MPVLPKLIPAEILAAALLVTALSCVGGTDKPKGFYGEVIAKRTEISPRTGDMVVVLTVGFHREPNSYEQDTREYPILSQASRFTVGDCVLVQPYGQDVRLSPCP